jgi:D-alanyl-D-alanine carboxypeptidase (penicillin-binding protein 5/6)
MQLIAVVLNCGPMFEESAMLMEQAFSNYTMVSVAQQGIAMGTMATREGITGSVQYGFARSVLLPMDAEEQNRLAMHICLTEPFQAPVAEGQRVGEAQILLDGQQLARIPLVSMQSVGRRTWLWAANQVIERFLWRENREKSGCKNIWPSAVWPRGENARN